MNLQSGESQDEEVTGEAIGESETEERTGTRLRLTKI